MSITVGTTYNGSQTTDFWTGTNWDNRNSPLSVTVASGQTVLCVRVSGTVAAITGMTFNGAALTERVTQGDGDQSSVKIWDLDNPTVGTFSLVITATATRVWYICANGLSGVDVGGAPRGIAVSAAGFSTAASVNATTIANDVVLDTVHYNATCTVGANQTAQVASTAQAIGFGAMSSEIATGATTTMSWTAASERWAIAAQPYKPAVAAAAFVMRKTRTQVGTRTGSRAS